MPAESFLVTMDIESLYTNAPFEGGLRASESFNAQTVPPALVALWISLRLYLPPTSFCLAPTFISRCLAPVWEPRWRPALRLSTVDSSNGTSFSTPHITPTYPSSPTGGGT